MTVAVGRLHITVAINAEPALPRKSMAERALARRNVTAPLARERMRWEEFARRATPWL